MDNMENKTELESQEFDLDEILNEFSDIPAEETADVEPDEELEELLQMPDLTITPVVVKKPEGDLAALLNEESAPTEDPALSGATAMFSIVTEEQAAQVPEESSDAAVSTDDTVPLHNLADLAEEVPVEEETAAPAFDVPEEFTPSPILFRPRSQLRELKKQLVAGPEKRYYELTAIGTGRVQLALLINILIVLACAGITAMFAMGMVPDNRLRLVIFSQVLAMMLSALLGSHLMLDSIADLLRFRFTVNTLLTLTFIACMVDALFCLKELRVPCCAAFSLEMTMALWARLQRRNTEIAQLDTLRKAVRLTGIIKAENYFEEKDGLLRVDAQVSDFMDTYSKTSSPELVQSIFAFLSLIACLGISGFSAYLHGISMGVQILSTSLLVAVPATFFISITRPMAILESRLHMVGTVLCGWEGVKDLCGKAFFPLKDSDLFPLGSIKLNGVKFYNDLNPDKVVSYSTSLILAGGGGLVTVFKQLLKSRSGITHKVRNFQSYGDRGIGGEVCGESILMGTPEFLKDMGVEIPDGTMVSQAVYAAIDGQLGAVYAISYAKMRSASAGLVTLCSYRKLRMLKLPGDFMLTENFLRNKFNIRTKRIRFLDWETAAQLNKFRPDPKEPVLAITTRDELVSAAYAVTGARALRQSTKLGVLIHLLGGTLGLIIMLVLGYLGSTELLTPTNILLYQLIWAIPGLLITEWTRVV